MTYPLTSHARRWFLYIGALLLLAALLFFLIGHKDEVCHKERMERVTVAYPSIPFAALAHIAKAQGFFEQEGVQVSPLVFSHGKPALQAVIDGRADFCAAAETPVALAILNGAKLSIIATIHSSSTSHGIVARKESGLVTPDDLRGKTIGTTLGTSAHFFLDAYLVSHGIPQQGVKLLDLKPEALLEALQEGRIDAACAFDPYFSLARRSLGDRSVSFYDEDIYRESFNVVGQTAFVETHPKTVRKVLLALLRAEEFVSRYPARAQRLVADGSGFDVDVTRRAWGRGCYQVTLDQSLLLALEDESRWAARRGFSRGKMPNYLQHLYVQGLESVKPQAVRILR